eukprot:5147991-Amphidinium_carterae.1
MTAALRQLAQDEEACKAYAAAAHVMHHQSKASIGASKHPHGEARGHWNNKTIPTILITLALSELTVKHKIFLK